MVYTAAGSNDCEGLEATYRQGYKQADAEDRPVEKAQRPRFICAKLPLRKLHYDDWHLADHSLVQNMPCAEKMRDTKLIWLNKINLVESAAHMLTLKGGARATLMEWVDADQLSELNDDAGVKKLEDVGMRWRDVQDRAGRLGDVAANQIPTETNAQRIAAAKSAAVASTNAARGSGKPPPGFKIIEGLEYGAFAKEQLPEDELDGWQARAADRVAAMSAIHPALGGRGRRRRSARRTPRPRRFLSRTACRLGVTRRNSARRSVHVQLFRRQSISRDAVRHRGDATSVRRRHLRFRRGVSSPGFVGWSVQNLTWAEDLDESYDRPGYPPHGAMYAKDGFSRGETCWSCICSTEEMIYNKMYRRNRNLFNPDNNCDMTKPYERLSKGDSGVAGLSAPPRLGMAQLGYPEPEAARRDRNTPGAPANDETTRG